jgi:hypothetical protein
MSDAEEVGRTKGRELKAKAILSSPVTEESRDERDIVKERSTFKRK